MSDRRAPLPKTTKTHCPKCGSKLKNYSGFLMCPRVRCDFLGYQK